MKKFFCIFSMICILLLFGTNIYATETNTDIPEMSFIELLARMQARQAKVDIIKKNNEQLKGLKEELRSKIIAAAEKVNSLKINISSGTVTISDAEINELKSLLEFLQESTTALNDEVQKVSSEIESILDLIQTRGMELAQYDLLIEKQNSVIVNLKNILQTVNQI
ncbi:MAG: hypothetical protein IJ220_09305 [Clostridia bacterium]|nr:hypothetical protein [Clostridia bacterium]